MPNFGVKNKDLFFKTLWHRGDLVMDCNSNVQNISNITIDLNATVGKDLTVFGNANIVNGFLCSKIIDKTGSDMYSKIKDTSVTIYDTTNQEFSSGFFVRSNGWIVSSAHGFLDSDVTTKHPPENIFVSVTNLNQVPNNNVVLQADSIYVDAAGDIAVIKVPGVTTQPYIQWGNSIQTAKGSRCYVIGNPLASDQQSISGGLVRDNEFVRFPTPLENVLTSISSYSGHSGSPILNELGHAIGILTFGIQGDANADVSTLTGGPSQRVAERIVDDMIVNLADYTQKGYMGVNIWFPVNTFDIIDLGLLGTGFTTKGIRLGNIEAGEALDLANLANDDVIISVNGLTVGDLDNQTHPSTVTWFKTPGETVQVNYIRPPSTTIISTPVTLGLYPPDKDIPLFGRFSGTGETYTFNLPGTRLRR